MVGRNTAKKIAQKVTAEDLKFMLTEAIQKVKNWEKASSVNPGMTKGTAFNIFTKVEITEHTHVIAKVNMIREFGGYLPDKYLEEAKPKKNTVLAVHQEPNDFLL